MCGVPIHAADQYLRKLIAGRPPRRDLRADRGPGRGEEARREVGRAPRRRAAGDAGHADRGRAALRRAQQFPRGACAPEGRRAAGDAYALAWIDISTGEFRLAATDDGASRRRSRARRARANWSCPTRCSPTTNWARSCAQLPFAVTPMAAGALRRRHRRRPARRLFRRRHARRLRRLHARRAFRRRRRCSPMSRRRR